VLVRHDLDLTRVGSVGDVPASMSRIQLGTEGSYKGRPFEVVGRIIYEYERGHWSEWHVRLADGTSAWLSDALAEYAVSRQLDTPANIPRDAKMRVGDSFRIDGTAFQVVTMTQARYVGVEGELPFEYWDKSEVPMVDLESTSGRFATIDYSEPEPLLFVGEYQEFDELELANLREIEGW